MAAEKGKAAAEDPGGEEGAEGTTDPAAQVGQSCWLGVHTGRPHVLWPPSTQTRARCSRLVTRPVVSSEPAPV